MVEAATVAGAVDTDQGGVVVVQLTDLLTLEDPLGFLTITASFAPETYAGQGPSAPPQVRSGIRDVLRAADDERRAALSDRLDRLSHTLDAFLAPGGGGRGRLLVVGVSTDVVHDVRLQVPLPTEVRLEDGPALRRVLEVTDELAPAAVLLLHREEALLLHLELGVHEPLRSWSVEFEDRVFAEEFYGKAPGAPSSFRRGITNREAREDRIQANLDRFLGDVADDVRDIVAELGLQRVVLVGQSHERTVVARGLGSVSGLTVLQVDRVADGPSRDVLDEVQRVLVDTHRAAEIALVRTALDRAGAGGAAVLGAAGVVRALGEGRVHHLLLTPHADRVGWIGSDGHLATTREDARLTDPRREPRLVHRMIERALDTDALVTPVDGEAAALLHEHDEIAALLRW